LVRNEKRDNLNFLKVLYLRPVFTHRLTTRVIDEALGMEDCL